MELNSVLVKELPRYMREASIREPRTTGFGNLEVKEAYTIIDNIARIFQDIDSIISLITETDIHELIHLAGEMHSFSENKVFFMAYFIAREFNPEYVEKCFRRLYHCNYVNINRAFRQIEEMRRVVCYV